MINIAIIEDDQAIAQMYRMKFESEGFAIGVAADGRSGVEMVSKHMPNLILLDLQMPEMNGHEALRQIRKLPGGQDIPVIVLTNLGQQEAPKDLVALGINSYIIKADLTPSQVVEHVKKTLGVTAEAEQLKQ
ncbi:MAG: response regulator [Candidatus Nomurabacteria bacterium]|jgi:CheY-like chemotaxis protein|nr:response regulator [Candidatus Nomurabacteria bacterium]